MFIQRQPEAVIGEDLKFAGQEVKIISQGKVEVDCEFEGDVTGTEVVISEHGKIKAMTTPSCSFLARSLAPSMAVPSP